LCVQLSLNLRQDAGSPCIGSKAKAGF